MAEQFDPYLHWLGIRDPQRPPNYYRLLGIELFESDPEVISNAADRQMAHVRTFQTGKHSALSQKILNELAAAKICLLNPEKKAQYDAELLAQQAAQQVMPPLTWMGVGGQPPPAGLWPLNPPLFPAPATEPPSPEAEPTEVGSVTSWFSFIATVLVAVILVLVGLIVAIVVKRSSEPSIGSPGNVEDSKTTSQPSPIGPKQTPESSPKKKGPTVQETKPQPKPPAPPQPPLPPTQESLQAVREALAQRNIEAARQHLELAHRAAPIGSPPALEVARLNLICIVLEEFWKKVAEVISQLQPGQVIGDPNFKAIVKLVSGDSVQVEINGQKHTFTWKNIPINLALLLHGLQANGPLPPEDLLSRAVAVICDPHGDLNVAEQLIQQAISAQIPYTEVIAEELKLAQATRARIPSPPQIPKDPEKPPPEKPEKPESPPKPKRPEPPHKRKRLPIPDRDAQQKALADIRHLLERDYKAAQKPEEKNKLAERLYHLGSDTRDNPAAQYMLFIEAMNLGLDAGNKDLVNRTLGRIAQHFEADLAKLSADFLEEAAKRNRAPAANQVAAQLAIELANEVFAKDKLPEAIRLAQAATELARKANDTLRTKRAAALRRRYEEFQPRYDAYVTAGQNLQSHPDDPEANWAYGFYLCFAKQAWASGLPHLAKGKDPILQELAQQELKTNPQNPNDMVALGDKWWEASAAVSNAAIKEAYRDRAAYWYRQALPNLTGLTKTRIERRLHDLSQ